MILSTFSPFKPKP